MKTFIIAEAGVNHNGDIAMAKQLVDEAVAAGADAVKFQSFIANELATPTAQKAAYQIESTVNESQFDMLKRLELTQGMHEILIPYCKEKNIMFLSTPFGLQSIKLLEQFGLEIFKIPSGGITDLPFLRSIGRLKKKVIISTGMATFDEVQKALDVLMQSGTPKTDITILHCTTDYPTRMEHVNLMAMVTMRDRLGVAVGYSDHTPGVEVPIAAVALGANVIEKHFTLNRNLPGPDHKASLEPAELRTMVTAIRNIEKALGDGVKRPTPPELEMKNIVRKSIAALRPIGAGEVFTEENITAKRPGTGVSPMEWDRVIGNKAERDFKKDELIEI